MKRRTFLTLSATLPLLTESAEPAAAREGDEPILERVKTVSTGAEITLANHLAPEVPTVFVFYRSGSAMEKQFVQSLQDGVEGKVGFRLIALKSGDEPVAKQYEVSDTPLALVYDRRKRLLVRSNETQTIAMAVVKAAQVMRLDWAEEGTPLFEEASQAAGGKSLRAGIMRTISLKPEYLRPFYAMTRKAHFEDGFLPRRTKEMIATYVSAINHCKF
jgi:alkylhydroperoxidase/carboxymuconolactone decarboxylase family protein YurZ